MQRFLLLCLAIAVISGKALAGERFTVVERAISDKIIHVAGQDDKFGNLVVFADPVYDAANRIQVGRDQGFCVRVVVGKAWECFWSMILKGGVITTEGPNVDHGDSVLAVTGGTGRYAGAKGTIKLHSRDAQDSAWDITYDLE